MLNFDAHLDDDEQIIWTGKPSRGIKFRSSDILLIPFSLIWGGFAIYWEFSVLTMIPEYNPTAILFSIFGSPFIFIGLYIIFGRFIVDAKSRDKTEYALTNQRILIKSGIFSSKIKSIGLRFAREVTFSEKYDGSGTITFNESNSPWGTTATYLFLPGLFLKRVSEFEMIDNVGHVYSLIRKAQNDLN